MDDIQNYALVTTIAVCLLALSQIIFLVFLTTFLTKAKKAVNNIQQTSDMSKDFIRSLRDEQLRRVSLWQLGLFAFKRAKSMKRK